MSRLYEKHQPRIKLISIIFSLFYILILSKTFFIQSFKSAELKSNTYKTAFIEKSFKGSRGKIYARNGEILAETINKYTFWANTNKEIEKKEIIDLFSNELDKTKEEIKKILIPKKSYIKLADNLLRTESLAILSKIKNINGLHCDIYPRRFYPFENLTSHVIGYLDQDDNGQVNFEIGFSAKNY